MSTGNVISGFCREVDKKFALLPYHTASSDISLPTFQDNQSIPSSRRNQLVVLSYENIFIYDNI